MKTVEICLNDLYVQQEYLKDSIKYVLLGFLSCPPVAIDENGNTSIISDTPVNSNTRATRGKTGIIGTQLNWQQGKELITNFFLILFQYFDVDRIINIVINVKTNEQFLDIRLENFLKTEIQSREVISQNIIQTYESLYKKFFELLSKNKIKNIDYFLETSKNLTPDYFLQIKSTLTMSTGGKKNKKKTRKQKYIKKTRKQKYIKKTYMKRKTVKI